MSDVYVHGVEVAKTNNVAWEDAYQLGLQNGYRLFRVACLEGLELRTTRYDTETEILVRLARRGYRIGAVPVSTIYGDEKSSINPFVDTGRFFRLVTILLASRREERRT